MGLDEYKSELEEDDESVDVNVESVDTDSDEYCPNCEERAEHMYGSQWKCTTDKDRCEVLSYITTDYEVNNANV